MSKRAIRRHHRERLKNKRKGYYGYFNKTETTLGMLVNTPTPCSCSMCGNQRRNKWLPKKDIFTNQEKRNIIDYKEQIEEIE